MHTHQRTRFEGGWAVVGDQAEHLNVAFGSNPNRLVIRCCTIYHLPAEWDTGMFGGNSNWRGPIWMPVNVLLIRALMQYYLYYGTISGSSARLDRGTR